MYQKFIDSYEKRTSNRIKLQNLIRDQEFLMILQNAADTLKCDRGCVLGCGS